MPFIIAYPGSLVEFETKEEARDRALLEQKNRNDYGLGDALIEVIELRRDGVVFPYRPPPTPPSPPVIEAKAVAA
jgi:hypothetical protein